jgi:hypothetical protein
MWKFRELGEGEPERSPHEAEFFNVDDLDASASLVRESIQNSLDAKLNSHDPVHIKFTLGSESKTKINPYIPDLLSHVQNCGFKLNAALKDDFTYLVIEDFGTKGLDGPISRTEVGEDKKSNYYNMWWREGISRKEGRDAGRWGLGKTVFFVCSELRSFWGLTIRHDDNRQLLLGKALLKSHQYNGTQYDYYGYYCEGENQPIDDPRAIQKFKKRFQISRNGESGLSIVIPYPVAEITRKDLIRAIIQHYFYSIIRGFLTVDIYQDSLVTIDKKSIFEIASKDDWKLTSWENHPVSMLLYFINNAVNMPESQFITLSEFKLPKITEELFEDRLEKARKSFSEGKMVSIKVPVSISPLMGESIPSYFNVFIQKDEKLPRNEEFYIRSGITISEIKMLRGSNIRALLTAEDDAIARFLGDSESPAHTNWKERTENFKQKYQNAVFTLRYIRGSLRDIALILDVPSAARDPDFLKEIFHIPEKRGEAVGEDPEPLVPPDDLKRQGLFIIHRQPGGFRLSLEKNEQFQPFLICVEVAYDTKTGNPFSRYDPLDFMFDRENTGYGKINPQVKEAQIRKIENNKIFLSVENPKFELKTTGFDENRDIVISVKRSDL